MDTETTVSETTSPDTETTVSEVTSSETETTISEVTQPELDVEDNKEDEVSVGKSDEEKLKEFKEWAQQKYKSSFIIGEQFKIEDLLKDQTYSENPDGSGRKGEFNYCKNISISHINIITNKGWTVVRDNGKNLDDLLSEYPDCIEYNIHFIDSDTGSNLGFITNSQLDNVIQKAVDTMINSKKSNSLKHLDENKVIEDDNER